LFEQEILLFHLIEKVLSSTIENAIQQLLTTKHLYQSIRIKFPERDVALEAIKRDLPREFGPNIETIELALIRLYQFIDSVPWKIPYPGAPLLSNKVGVYASIEFSLKTIRSYCRTCGDIEPYNFVDAFELLSSNRGKNDDTQLFTFAYECQGCKGVPEVFLVQREKLKITLCGRSPMEQVIVAPQIPKPHNKYISDAIVAYNSGQILAGIFMLRTFLEQFVRSKSKTPETDNIDTLFQEYSSPLPLEFKNHFPSLKSIYDDLSVAIHLANPSDDVYQKALEEIEHHFEGKKAFRIAN